MAKMWILIACLKLVGLCFAGETSTSTVSTQAPSPLCNDYLSVLVGSSPSGIHVKLLEGENSTFTVDVPNRHLSPLCEADPRRCHTLIEGRFVVVPVVDGLVFVDFQVGSTQVPRIVDISAHDCSPIDLFVTTFGDFDTIHAACINTSSSLTYLEYFYSIDNDGVLEVNDMMAFSPPPPPLSSAQGSGFSETIVVSDHCSGSSTDSKFYVVADNFIWHHPASTSGGTNSEFTRNDVRLENCTAVSFLEHTGSSDVFTIHCSNGVAIRYSTCTESIRYFYLGQRGVPFSCSSQKNLYYRTTSVEVEQLKKDSVLPLLMVLNHTVGEIRYGKCQGDFFTAVATNGSTYVLQLNTSGVSYVADVCHNEGSGSCLLPSFGPTGFVAYDFSRSTLLSVTLVMVEECGEGPVVEVMSDDMNFLPPLLDLVSIVETRHKQCECSKPTTPTIISTTTTTTTTTTLDTSPSIPFETTVGESGSDTAVIAGSTVGVLVVVLILIGVISAVLYKRCRQIGPSAVQVNSLNQDADQKVPEAVTAHHNGDSSMMVVSAPLPSATQLHPDLVKDTHQKRLDTDDKRNDRTVKMGALRT